MSEDNAQYELKLLKLLMNYDFYDSHRSLVVKEMFGDQLEPLYKTIIAAHEKYKKNITTSELRALFRKDNPTITRAAANNIHELINDMELDEDDIGPDVAYDILQHMWKSEVGRRIAEEALKLMENKSESLEPIVTIIERTQDNFLPAEMGEVCTTDVDELLELLDTQAKFNFNLSALSAMVSGVSPGDFVMILARPECVAPDTSILMFDGSVKSAGEVQVGDLLMGPDGTSREVLSMQTGQDEMYRVSYPWGEYYDVNAAHKLALSRSKEEGKHKYGSKLDVPVDEYLAWPESRQLRYKGYKLGAVEFGGFVDELPIDPYILGVWLGDGSTHAGIIHNIDSEVLDAVRAVYGSDFYQAPNQDGSVSWSVRGLKTQLRSAGVLGNKHIPQAYKSADLASRQSLLAGIIDTDGYVVDTQIEIIQKSKTLAYDIVFLARSLGFHATVKEAKKGCEYKGEYREGTYYRIGLYGDRPTLPIQIQRKQIPNRTNSKRKSLQFSFTVSHVGKGQFVGIEVDKDNKFVLGDFTVTNNCGKTAFITSMVAGPGGFASQGHKVHVICNEEPAPRTMLRMISSWTGMTRDEIMADRDKAKALFAQVRDNIRLVYDTDMTVEKLDAYCRQHKPDILIIDQLDKLGVFGSFARGDERLGKIYVKARQIAIRHECAVFGICQASAEAEGKTVVTYAHAADSKTAKAAECDLIMGLGREPINEEIGGENHARYITLSKNKITGKLGKLVCFIDPPLSRYVD